MLQKKEKMLVWTKNVNFKMCKTWKKIYSSKDIWDLWEIIDNAQKNEFLISNWFNLHAIKSE